MSAARRTFLSSRIRHAHNAAVQPPAQSGLRRLPTLICALLLALFLALSWTSVQSKSPTFDETLHAATGWSHRHLHDYRANPEDPPLWKRFAVLPHPSDALHINPADPHWTSIPSTHESQWPFSRDLLYRTPGRDGLAFIQRSRAVMLIPALLLGILLAIWARQLAGPAAAIIAATLFALDPNFIAHAPLVKNDVAFTASLFAAVYFTWLVGRRATTPRILALIATLCLAIGTKFSALLLAPIVTLLLLLRAMDRHEWSFPGRFLTTRRAKLLAALSLWLLVAVSSYAFIWGMYGNRFSASADPSERLNFDELLTMSRSVETIGQRTEGAPQWEPSLATRALLFLNDRHLLPEPFVYGLLYTRASSIARPAYLLGETQSRGWAWYFPFAMLVKTPLATIAAAILAIAVFLLLRRRPATSTTTPSLTTWTRLCILIPLLIYGLAAINTRLNLGLRHVLPLYPFLYLAIAITLSKLFELQPRRAILILSPLALLLLIETLIAFPHYIAFFNAPSAAAGRLHLLSDSNLDWGQDLPLLAQWQRNHPDRPLYLLYFGTADPAAYGIRYTPLPGMTLAPDDATFPDQPGVLAISATHLQGTYLDAGPLHRTYKDWIKGKKPLAILGHSIYLYEVDAK